MGRVMESHVVDPVQATMVSSTTCHFNAHTIKPQTRCHVELLMCSPLEAVTSLLHHLTRDPITRYLTNYTSIYFIRGGCADAVPAHEIIRPDSLVRTPNGRWMRCGEPVDPTPINCPLGNYCLHQVFDIHTPVSIVDVLKYFKKNSACLSFFFFYFSN